MWQRKNDGEHSLNRITRDEGACWSLKRMGFKSLWDGLLSLAREWLPLEVMSYFEWGWGPPTVKQWPLACWSLGRLVPEKRQKWLGISWEHRLSVPYLWGLWGHQAEPFLFSYFLQQCPERHRIQVEINVRFYYWPSFGKHTWALIASLSPPVTTLKPLITRLQDVTRDRHNDLTWKSHTSVITSSSTCRHHSWKLKSRSFLESKVKNVESLLILPKLAYASRTWSSSLTPPTHTQRI